MPAFSRRAALFTGLTGSGLLLSGCAKILGADDLTGAPGFQHVLNAEQAWTLDSQRFLLSGGALAKEYTVPDISPRFKANGTLHPGGDDYAAAVAENFASWKLKIDGMVERPMALSVAELRRLPARTQITRHDCVEGWSCIGEWTGAKMSAIAGLAGLKPATKHLVLYCADTLGGAKYYETLDLVDVVHPQTILAYDMNGAPLTIAHGAPIRLRAERYLGYKQAKYVMRLEAVDRFTHIAGGQGGYWEDQGYDRFGGI